jgi:sterol desaturase/sphingolipid hydroxylase (fatty acid hydroxylase superfamily)
MEEQLLDFWLRVSRNITVRYFLIAGLAYFVFYFLLKNQFINRKIQNKYPQWGHMKLEIFFSLQTVLIFATVATLVFNVLGPYTHFYAQINDKGWLYYVATFPLMFVIHDTYFYWMHRTIHHPKLYRLIHERHHKSLNPTPWSSYSFHLIESFLEAGIIFLIAFTLPVHRSALALFLLMQFVYNVYGHLGYELYPKGFHKTWIGRWVNTSVAHNMHHKYFKGNYGLYFLFWDRAMGTLHPHYDKEFERVTTTKQPKPVLDTPAR